MEKPRNPWKFQLMHLCLYKKPLSVAWTHIVTIVSKLGHHRLLNEDFLGLLAWAAAPEIVVYANIGAINGILKGS